jgi:hypothetical protein
MKVANLQASDSGHWYQRDGAPMYTVEAKDGSQRNTTLRDARKLNLVPSVTTILKCAASPGLDAWKQNQLLLAVLTLPRGQTESEDAWLVRVVRDSKETGRKAADRGTEIHGAIEQFYEGVLIAEMMDYQLGVDAKINEHFGKLELKAEKSFSHELGFGGKVDLQADGVVIDIKTSDFTDPKKVVGYESHLMQLSAYRVGLGMPEARCANVFVSRVEPGLCHVIEWSAEDLNKGWEMFRSLLNYWQASKSYK